MIEMQDGKEIKSLVISGIVTNKKLDVSAPIPSPSDVQINSWRFKIQSIGKLQKEIAAMYIFLILGLKNISSFPLNNFFAVTCNLHSSEKLENNRVISSPTLLGCIHVELKTGSKDIVSSSSQQVNERNNRIVELLITVF